MESNNTSIFEAIVKGVEKRYEDKTVLVREVSKMNLEKMHGLTITDGVTNISPCIYIDKYVADVESGLIDIMGAVDEIADIYENNKNPQMLDIDKIMSKDFILANVSTRVYNKERNTQLLETMPHLDYLDLAVAFVVNIANKADEIASITINNDIAARLDIELGELIVAAEKTAVISGYNARHIADVLGNAVDLYAHDEKSCKKIQDAQMVVVTNHTGNYGASAIYHTDILSQCAKLLGENFYILPSSLHELIILPESVGVTTEMLKMMVSDVNKNVLKTKDFLSDSVYFFNVEKNAVEIL